ncbi:MAG TPA: hypothetical protein VIO94_14295, partial [Phenylobacterium sp.]
DEEAHVYAEGVRRGGTLISVKAEDGEAERIEQILHGRSGVDAAARGQDYRQSGWSRFDETSTPYSAEEIAAERQRYGESRSFAGGEPRDDSLQGDRDRPLGGSGAGLGSPRTDI